MMVQRLQDIIESGQIPEHAGAETLRDTLVLIDFEINSLENTLRRQASRQVEIVRLRAVRDRLQTRLNSRHGLDGMTPV